MTYSSTKISLKSWAEEDRPREKLALKGKQNLSDTELLAILIGSGTRNETAVGIAKGILKSVNHNLNELAKLRLNDLQKFEGIGTAKSIIILAALELGRRKQFLIPLRKHQIKCSQDIFSLMGPILADLSHEEFWMVTLNRSNRVIGKEQISRGGVAGTVVDAKLIFRKALDNLASSIILCHNHPSGSLKPSQADIEITKKIKRAGENLDIGILDHLILSEAGYFSFADEGML